MPNSYLGVTSIFLFNDLVDLLKQTSKPWKRKESEIIIIEKLTKEISWGYEYISSKIRDLEKDILLIKMNLLDHYFVTASEVNFSYLSEMLESKQLFPSPVDI